MPEARKPKRIQRRRTKNWRMPDRRDAVYVGRPTKWGNPFNWKQGVEIGGVEWAKGAAVDLYREWVTRPAANDPRKPPSVDDIKTQLRGKDLICWCRDDEPCHADVLLRIANS